MASGGGVTVVLDGMTPNQFTSPVSTIPGIDPRISGVYAFTLNDALGVATANNYMVLWNPLGSGRNIFPFTSRVSSYISSGSNTSNHSLQIMRVTALTGGTIQSVSAIAKAVTTYPNPAAQIITGNPTATTGGTISAVNLATNATGGATSGGLVSGPTGGGPLIIAPGEGVAWFSAGTSTSVNINTDIFWGEI